MDTATIDALQLVLCTDEWLTDLILAIEVECMGIVDTDSE